ALSIMDLRQLDHHPVWRRAGVQSGQQLCLAAPGLSAVDLSAGAAQGHVAGAEAWPVSDSGAGESRWLGDARRPLAAVDRLAGSSTYHYSGAAGRLCVEPGSRPDGAGRAD